MSPEAFIAGMGGARNSAPAPPLPTLAPGPRGHWLLGSLADYRRDRLGFMPLAQRLAELVQACFTGIWVESHEHEDALAEIASLCREQAWQLMSWDLDQGIRMSGAVDLADTVTDPLAAIRSLTVIESKQDSSCLLVLRNFHRFLQSAEIVQALVRQLASGKQHRTFVVILAPLVQIPVELEKQFIVIEHVATGT